MCPFSAAPLARRLPELAASQDINPFLSEATLAQTPSGKAFQRRWASTPLSRPGLKNLLRNLRALHASKQLPEPSRESVTILDYFRALL